MKCSQLSLLAFPLFLICKCGGFLPSDAKCGPGMDTVPRRGGAERSRPVLEKFRKSTVARDPCVLRVILTPLVGACGMKHLCVICPGGKDHR